MKKKYFQTVLKIKIERAFSHLPMEYAHVHTQNEKLTVTKHL